MQIPSAPFFLITTALMLSLLGRCGTPITGGGEIGNPKTIAGKVIDKNNRGVVNMKLCLLASREFNPVAESLADTAHKPFETVHPIAVTMTDSTGSYTMTVPLNAKSYTLFGTIDKQIMDSMIRLTLSITLKVHACSQNEKH